MPHLQQVQSSRYTRDVLPGFRTVDITSLPVEQSLSSLAALHNGTELIVRISAPVHIRMVPIISPQLHKEAKAKGRDADDMIDSFMSSWTRLVGDPILSKWIVLLLGVSVALNGYLLKGISTGTGSTRRVQQGQGVRFDSVDRGQEKQLGVPSSFPAPILINPDSRTEEVAVYSAAPPVVRPVPVPAVPRAPSVNGISSLLDSVDQKLKAQQPTFTTSDESDSQDEESSTKETSSHIRTLEECVDIFENGPRPVSVSLSLLNDEEVILLAQNGKIQAYALEKVLGDLERAVLIRRALICMCSYILLEAPVADRGLQPVRREPRRLNTPTYPCHTTIILASWELAVRMLSAIFLFPWALRALSILMASCSQFPWRQRRAHLLLQRPVVAKPSTLEEVSLPSSPTMA